MKVTILVKFKSRKIISKSYYYRYQYCTTKVTFSKNKKLLWDND